MKYIKIVILILFPVIASAQFRLSPYAWEYYSVKHDSLLVLPKILTNPSLLEDGAIRYSGTAMQLRKSGAWADITSAGFDSTTIKQRITLADPELLGTIFDKTTFPNTSDFVSNGTITATASGGVIALSSSVLGSMDNSIDIPSNTMLQYWRMKMVYKVNSAMSASSHGLGIGIRSVNAAVNSSVAGYVDLSTDATGGQRAQISNTYPTNFTVVSRSPNQLPYSNGDTLELIVERSGNLFTVAGRDITTNSAYVRTSFTFTTANTSQNMANTGRFAIFAFGGNYDVQSLNIYSKEVKNAEVMAIGDSKTQGYVSDYAITWPNLLRTSFGSVVTSAGGGDKTTEIISRLDEINRLKPKQILLEIGTNDPDTTVFKTNYQSLVNSLNVMGVPIYHMTFYTANNAWRNNFIKRTYPTASIIDTWSATRVPGALGGDGTHLTNLGDSIIYQTILNSGRLNQRGKAFSQNSYTTGPVNFISKFDGSGALIPTVAYDNGKDIGIGLTTPTNPTGSRVMHIHDSTAASSPTIHLTNGDIGSGAGAGTAIFVGNAASTGAGSFNIYNQDPTSGIHLFTSAANRFSILSNGNIGIATSAPTSTLQVAGSTAYATRTVTATATLAITDHYLLCNNTTAIVVNLPSASTCLGREYVITKINAATANITITPASGTINGAATLVITSNFTSQTIYTDGTNWYAR